MSNVLEYLDLDLAKITNLEPISLLNLTIALQLITGTIFLLLAFSVSSTSNIGFNVVLTAVLFLIYPGIAYAMIHIWKTPLTLGKEFKDSII